MNEIVFLPHEKWAEISVPNLAETSKKYAISNLGRVVSYTNKIAHGRLIAKANNSKTVAELCIKTKEKKVRYKVHKLVAEYFLPKPLSGYKYVLHLDKKLNNNSASNLMYADYRMYLQHISGKKKSSYKACKLFIGEVAKTIEEPFKQKKYAITSFGRLVSFESELENDGVIIDGAMHKEGYKIWRYKIGNQYKHKLVHRLVAEYFVPRPSEEHKFVIHLDHNKLNNVPQNLQWATQEQLTLHSSLSEAVILKRSHTTDYFVQKGRGAKLTLGKVMLLKKILKEANNPTRKRLIAKQFGISSMQLFRIQTGENWGWLNETTSYNHLSINEN
jgi:hypothetical protein